MHFQNFDWLNDHRISAITPCRTMAASEKIVFATELTDHGVNIFDITPLAIVRYKVIMAHSALCASLVIYQLAV